MYILNKANFVDLGLPSGILWSKKSLYSFVNIPVNRSNFYIEVIHKIRNDGYLPTIENLEELRYCCTINEYKKDRRMFVIRSKINNNYLIMYSGFYLLHSPDHLQNIEKIDEILNPNINHFNIFPKPFPDISPFFIRLIKKK